MPSPANDTTDAQNALLAAAIASLRPLSYRRIAARLGLPPAAAGTICDVANGRLDHVSAARLDDLRRRLGLPVLVTIPAVPCPTCNVVHGDGYDCHGARIQIVRRRPHPARIQDMTAAQLRTAILNRIDL